MLMSPGKNDLNVLGFFLTTYDYLLLHPVSSTKLTSFRFTYSIQNMKVKNWVCKKKTQQQQKKTYRPTNSIWVSLFVSECGSQKGKKNGSVCVFFFVFGVKKKNQKPLFWCSCFGVGKEKRNMENATNPKLILVQLFFIVGEHWKN